jgi:hypothetical protein
MEYRIEDAERSGVAGNGVGLYMARLQRDSKLCWKGWGAGMFTNLYLNAKFRHHPSNKQVVLSTPIHRAIALCD